MRVDKIWSEYELYQPIKPIYYSLISCFKLIIVLKDIQAQSYKTNIMKLCIKRFSNGGHDGSSSWLANCWHTDQGMNINVAQCEC